jgi:HlyD family secretion protein
MKRWLVAILLLAGVAGTVWYVLFAPATPAMTHYRTHTLARGDLVRTVSANGTINPVALVQVGAQISGMVKKIYVDFNDHVTEGAVLLELDSAVTRAQVRHSEGNVAGATASLALARANHARKQELFRQQQIAREALEQSEQAMHLAQAQLTMAQAQLEKDRTHLGYTVIRSPVTGVVVERQVDAGQTIAASLQAPVLFRIAGDLQRMQIDTSFAEADIGLIRPGQTARFRVDAFPGQLFHGTVRQVRLGPTIQQNVVTYNVVIVLDNPDGLLLPGMTAYVNIDVEHRRDVLLVPNAALRLRPPADQLDPESVAPSTGAPGNQTGKPPRSGPNEARGWVYVPSGDRLRAVPVTLGMTDRTATEITSGPLNTGDQIVLESGGKTPDRATTTAPAGNTGTRSRPVHMRLF